ncbi:MAG: hypothetical protein ALECFALPRED_005303 [Alectoria fallacina]|uniref:Mitochondrial import inner membrane translocase subunit TIM50 n=1 Tax=Alectoria fallacina TaxID=1903189 RepID=A0A8H3IAJ1_9LECA|nr:MAG: hypothetical protein ALECFALPRED_005303 [Alectoria fallacina]
MDNEETLGMEKLGLEKPATFRNASRADKGKVRRGKDKAFLQSELQQVSGQRTSSIRSWDPSAFPSYQPLPIAPLGSSADALNHLLSQNCHHGFVQISPSIPSHHPVQTSVSAPGPPSVSRYQQGFTPINGQSAVPRVTAVPVLQPRVLSRDSEPTMQKSTLYSKANPPLIDIAPVQHGTWIGSPLVNLQEAVSRPSRSSQSTKPRDLEATPSATRKPSPSIAKSKDDLIHLPAPDPTSAYLSGAHAISSLLSSPQRLLLILDLNGTLLYRPRASQNYTPRPCLPKFLKYAFANHSLLVWSSAQPYNVKGVCTRLFSPGQREMLLGEWGRDTLGLTSAQYKKRVQVYKHLDRIWGNENLQQLHPNFERGQRWGQQNTVLIDDSVLKASAQPFNHVEVPEFVRSGSEKEGDGRNVLGQVVGYLEEARKWSDVSVFVRHRRFEIDAGWRWEWQKKKPQGYDQCEKDDKDGGVRL